MSQINPRFFNSRNKPLAWIEWVAIEKILYSGQSEDMQRAFIAFAQQKDEWALQFQRRASLEQRKLLDAVKKEQIAFLEVFYQEADKLLKPRPRGKALRDKKKRTAQKAYQRQRLGEAFIDNPALLSDARKMAFELAEDNASRQQVTEKVTQLILAHQFLTPTDGQITTLFDYVERQMAKHLSLERIEAAIIDTEDKNLVFMWCKIKRRYAKYDSFVWPTEVAARNCKCSKSEVRPIMQKLEKLGAIQRIQAGKPGPFSKRAALYRRQI